MNFTKKLDIEKDPKLLTQYGRAFAWINYVDTSLSRTILTKGKLFYANQSIALKIIDGAMFGQKIELAEDILKPDLIKKLRKLNKYRTILAHGIIGNITNKNEDNNFVIRHVNRKSNVTQKKLTTKYLEEIINEAISIKKELDIIFINWAKGNL